MGDDKRHELARKELVYPLEVTQGVTVARHVEIAASAASATSAVSAVSDQGPVTMNLYHPADQGAGLRPAVLFVGGYSDLGSERFFGCAMQDMESSVGWARLVAAHGMIGITYRHRQPVADGQAVLAALSQRGAEWGIDGRRLGLWACSGNAPLAVSWLMAEAPWQIRAAALLYPLLLDLAGATAVGDAARQFGFVQPAAGRSVGELKVGVPLLLVRAGLDEIAGLNEGVDRFVGEAREHGLPLTLLHHPTGPHAFDLHDDSETSRQLIAEVVAFLASRLQVEA